MDKSARNVTQTFSMLSLWRVLVDRKRSVFIPVVVFALLGVLLSLRLGETFTAESLIVIQSDREAFSETPVLKSELSENPAVAVEIFASRQVLSLIVDDLNLMENPDFNPDLAADGAGGIRALARRAEAVVSRLAFWSDGPQTADDPPQRDARAREAVIDTVEELVQVEVDPVGTLVRVVVRYDDPGMAARIANSAAKAFSEAMMSERLDAVERLVGDLGRRLRDVREQVQDGERALQDFTNTTEISEPQLVQALSDESARLRERLESLRQQLNSSAARRAEVEALQGLSPEAVQEALGRSEALADLADRAGGDRDDLVSRIAEAAGRAADRDAQLVERTESSLRSLEARIDRLSRDLLRYQQLQREVNASREIYSYTQRELNNISLQSVLAGGSARIILPAMPPMEPDPSLVAQNLVIWVMLGLVTGIGWALLRDAVDRTIRRPGDVEALFPEGRVLALPAPPVGHLYPAALLCGPDPDAFENAVRRVRALLLQGPKASGRVVQLTSDVPVPGKPLLTLALAHSCARAGKRVLLVDVDPDDGTLANALDMTGAKPGLADIILGRAQLSEAVRPHGETGIDVLLTHGSWNAADLLEHAGLPDMMRAAASAYDIVIFDTPAILHLPAAVPLARHCDQTILSLAMGGSTAESMAEAAEQLFAGPGAQGIFLLLGAGTPRSHRATRAPRQLVGG